MTTSHGGRRRSQRGHTGETSFRPRPWNDVSGFRALFRLNLERGLYDGGWNATLQHGQTRTGMTGCCPLQAKIRGLLSEVLRYTFAFPMHYFPRVGAYSPARNPLRRLRRTGRCACTEFISLSPIDLLRARRVKKCAEPMNETVFAGPATHVRGRAHVTFYSAIFYESDLLTRAIPGECFLDRSAFCYHFDVTSRYTDCRSKI